VLRNTVGRELPSALLTAPKRGFGIPLREWFKDKEFDQLLVDNLDRVNYLLDKPTIAKIIEQNRSGKKDNGNFIWTMIQLNQNLN